jgi:Tfp pilus assembly PilM family ATPase
MGFNWLTNSMSSQPIAVHFGSDIVRMMQIRGNRDRYLNGAVEVASQDSAAIKIALNSFKGKRCVVCICSSDVLVNHVRVPIDANEKEIRQRLIKLDCRWGVAELRTINVTTAGSGGSAKQEMLCVGIEQEKIDRAIDIIEEAGGSVVAVTVPLYASLRAFDQLYRRDGDEKITSLVIDLAEDSSIVMISHGSNCVFAHRLDFVQKVQPENDEQKQKQDPSLTPITKNGEDKEFERRSGTEPKGLHLTQHSSDSIEEKLERELQSCLRHHGTLFADRVVDRVIFTGLGASDTQMCSAIASKIGLEGYVSDPSAWVKGADGYVSGPAWTTAAGICMRYAGAGA